MGKTNSHQKWVAENTTRIVMNLNHNTDKDVLEKLSQVPSKQGYIKRAPTLQPKEVPENIKLHIPSSLLSRYEVAGILYAKEAPAWKIFPSVFWKM